MGGGATEEIRKLGLAVLQCDKFNVEGIRSCSTSEKGGGRSWLCDKLGGGGRGYTTWKREIAGQRTIESWMEVLIFIGL